MEKMYLHRNLIGVFLCLGFMCSCSHSNLERIVKNAVKDENISMDEWKSITQVAQEENVCCDEGQVNVSALKSYVLNIAHTKMRGIGDITFPTIQANTLAKTSSSTEPIKIKFFLERSGSMIPYDSPRTKGDFKAAISRLLNSVPNRGNENNLMYVVNNSVYPYQQTYKDFLRSKDIFNDTKGIGDPRYTDFTCIFDSILTRTQSNELSILVSDLIYSTKDMERVNPQKIKNEAQTMTTNIFKSHADKDVLVMKLHADYYGKYYPYNSPNRGVHYEGNRPFYIMLVANPEVMRRIFIDSDYREFSDMERLDGFEDYYCFSHASVTPYYSVLLSDKRNKGRFGAVRGSGTTIHEIENIKSERDGQVAITLAVDLSGVITGDDYKKDKNNYEISSLSEFEIDEIEKIDLEDRTQSLEHYAPNATHLIVLSTDKEIKNETLSLRLKDKLPEWVSESTSEDDTKVSDDDFSKTTFAFSYLMQGIYEAFHPSTETPDFFELKLTINK